MRGAGDADVPFVLQMPGNKADAVPCERLQKIGFGSSATLVVQWEGGHRDCQIPVRI
jgi:hypothetical protein